MIEKAILANPEYMRIVRSRRNFRCALLAVNLVCFYIVMAIMGFSPRAMGTPLWEGSSISIGILVGLLLIVLVVITAYAYTVRAANLYDKRMQAVVDQARGAI